MRVLLIGGGIGALSAAIALERVGIEARVFERSPQLRASGGAIILWTNALNALRSLGLMDAVLEAGSPLEVNEFRSWRGELLTVLPIGELGRRFGAPTVVIHRAVLLQLLAARLPPGLVETGAACTGFHADAWSATALFANRPAERGDVLVGADGLHSTIRAQLFGPEPPRPVGHIGWIGIAEPRRRWLQPGVAVTTLGFGCRFWAVPFGNGRTFWYATLPEEHAGAETCRTREELRQCLAWWHPPIGELIDSTPDDTLIRTRITERAPLPRWGHGRVTLLGDSVHPSTPDLGQGACQSIESAVMLAWCLRHASHADTVPAALRAYEGKRQHRTAVVSLLSRLTATQVGTSHPAACLLREMAVRVGFREIAMNRFEWLLGHGP